MHAIVNKTIPVELARCTVPVYHMSGAGSSASGDVRVDILRAVGASPVGIPDSKAFASEHGVSHLEVVGATKSLQANFMVLAEPHLRDYLVLTAEAVLYAEHGSPEFQVLNAIPADGGSATGAVPWVLS